MKANLWAIVGLFALLAVKPASGEPHWSEMLDIEVDVGGRYSFVMELLEPGDDEWDIAVAPPIPMDIRLQGEPLGDFRIRITMRPTRVGMYAVTLVAIRRRDRFEVRTTIGINVIQPNDPPEWIDIPNPQVLSEPQRVIFNLSATDPDQDTLEIFAIENTLPEGAELFDQGDGQATFNWQTDYESAGNYEPIFVVSDGRETDTCSVRITVNNINLGGIILIEPPNRSFLSEDSLINFVW